jgi:hypothetical protein
MHHEPKGTSSNMRSGSKALRAMGSLLVVSAAAAYVVAPTKAVLSMKVTSQSALPAGYHAPDNSVRDSSPRDKSSGDQKGLSAVVYGIAKGDKGAVPEAGSVSLDKVLAPRSGPGAEVGLSPSGSFYAVVGAPKAYRIVVRAEFAHRWYQAGEVVYLRPGRDYDISAVLRFESIFTMLPVTSY